jgi:tetratricopeptide (TPR) repeat protein
MDLRVAVRKANALSKLGRTTDAIAEYQRALKIDPDNGQVKIDLETLKRV